MSAVSPSIATAVPKVDCETRSAAARVAVDARLVAGIEKTPIEFAKLPDWPPQKRAVVLRATSK
jgi:hypothetical protein